MKKIKYLFVFTIGVLLFGGCDQEEELSYVFQDISAPTNVQAQFDIAQDDSGEVSVTPTAEGATLFEIYFGDTENETPLELNPGETATHVYGEGEFNLRIVAIGMTGLTSELNRVVTISFAAPEDLQVDVTQSGRLEITVTPSATNATVYDIYFGESAEEEPVTIMDGESAVYQYAEAGEYTIRVVARGAGAATTETSVTFDVQDLTNAETFPIDFESNETLTGVFEGGAVSGGPVSNPDQSGINTSETVYEFVKGESAPWYSGIFHLFSEDMDLSVDQVFLVKIWSPKAGVNVRFQIEKENSDASPNLFLDQTVEVAEEWVTLTYDFRGIVDPANAYDKFVIFPDFDDVNQPAGDGSIYYIDDIVLDAPAAEPPQLPIDFEASNLDYTWNGFGSVDFAEIPAGVIANPDPSGINTSANVTFITKPSASQVWAGASLNLAGPIDFALGTTIDVKVWSPRAGTPILLKIEDSTSPPDGNNNPTVFAEVQASTTTASTWETLSFDMTSFGDFNATNSYDRVILFPDFGTSGQDEDFYFDDIEISTGGGGGGTTPTQPAPDPTQAQANVINMYSNSYTQDVVVSSWRSDWSTSTLTDIQVAGNDTKEYIDADFVGVEFYAPNEVDATDMDFFHMDIWTPNATTFRVKLVDLGTGNPIEGEIAFEGIAQGEWVSLDIPMEDFVNAGMTSVNSIQQLIFSGLPTGTFDFYIDNVYFYRVPPTSPSQPAPDPTEAQADVINLYSNAYTQDINVTSWRSDWSTSTLTDIQIDGNDTKEYIDADFVGVEFYGTPVDASNMSFFHVDVWTPNASTFRIKLVDLGTGNPIEAEIAFEGIAQGGWVSLDIPMSDFINGGMTATNSIQQLIFSGLPTGTFDFYIDNVYFHN